MGVVIEAIAPPITTSQLQMVGTDQLQIDLKPRERDLY
jgi:hypothetical protein